MSWKFSCTHCGQIAFMPDGDAPLSDWSSSALLAELKRREGHLGRRSTIVPCDECMYFIPLREDAETTMSQAQIDAYNPCSRGHIMLMHTPRDMEDINNRVWGFYRPGCRDRVRTEDTASWLKRKPKS